jgi:crotonobetainyl-CoA:carnitine CoA-transferase CaiB-like acyl-CoA transferase
MASTCDRRSRMADDKLPLAGIKVLDLGRILAAPLAAQALGDLGAEVIKIERPGTGDEARRWGPPFLKDPDGNDTRESPMYLCANRNKRSLTVDLSKPEGQALVRRLAARSDVLIENYKVGDLDRYGLGYEGIREVNPGIVYCSVTGFGQSGPYSRQPGYDSVFQAMSGLMSVTGLPDDVPGGGPMKTGPSLADYMASQAATTAIVAALYGRDASGGCGRHIDISLLDSTIAAQSHYMAGYLATGNVPQRRGTEGNGGIPSQAFPCADRSIVVICGSEAQYRRFCAVLRHPELADDARFRSNAERLAHRGELARTFGRLTSDWQSADLLAALDAAGIPCGPINSYPEVFADPHVVHRQMTLTVRHVQGGDISLCASPIRYAGQAPRPAMAPPILGQHTDDILMHELGLGSEEIERLRERQVI